MVLVVLCAAEHGVSAQTFTAAGDFLFYGDNTEFANQFRSGETTLGAAGRLALEVGINDRVRLRVGFFGSGRFGAHEAFDSAEPLVALEVSSARSRFIFGSLETTATRHDVAGPDVETPHALLPPLQQETLTFTRGQEMGLQWLVDSERLTHDAWINWQRLNTAASRERFDAGYRAVVSWPDRPLWLHGQWHVVHEGGQQFNSGAVSDSQGFALGAELAGGSRLARVSVEAHAVATRNVPDRERPQSTEAGLGIFTRAAAARGAWRTHLIVWRSRDTLKAEGDPNYLAARRDGRLFRKVRDYAEVGLTRHFRPAPGVHMFAAVRMHRVESHYEYSYRIVGRVRLRKPL
jgi:hypothetical protein